MIRLIVAMSENRVIGKEGKIPWRLPGDLLRFKLLTMHQSLIMGRGTYDSIGSPLKGRYINVVTSSRIKTRRNVKSFSTLESAYIHAKYQSSDVWIVGGHGIYKEALETLEVQEIYMTLVHKFVEGDAYFPLLPEGMFEIESIEENEDNGIEYSYAKLVRQKESV